MDSVKAIVFGRRTAGEIVAALRASPYVADHGCEVVPTLDRDWTRIMFRLAGGPGVRRELWIVDGDVVREADESGAHVHSGPRMLLTMDAREGCAHVVRSLVASFGGFICPSAQADEWHPVEVAESLSRDAYLKLGLAKIVGPEDARRLSAVLGDPVRLAALRGVLDEAVRLHEAGVVPAPR